MIKLEQKYIYEITLGDNCYTDQREYFASWNSLCRYFEKNNIKPFHLINRKYVELNEFPNEAECMYVETDIWFLKLDATKRIAVYIEKRLLHD